MLSSSWEALGGQWHQMAQGGSVLPVHKGRLQLPLGSVPQR